MAAIDKLIALTNQLLDLSKRNRLLNYKDTGLRTLKIVNNNQEDIFKGLTNGSEFSIFSYDTKVKELLDDKTKTEAEAIDAFLAIAGEKTDINSSLIAFKKDNSSFQTLKNLNKEFNTSINEKGINCLYMTFGFVNYTEEEESFKAPILLVPIEIERINDEFKIKEYEDEVLLNPTLTYYFKSTYECEFPNYNYTKLSTYFSKLDAILPDNASIDFGIAIGVYSFYKMNMYNDIMQNKDLVIQNDNIKVILGDKAAVTEREQNKDIFPVVNFDSSQKNAVKLALDGTSFTLQGPPGSGKSQTITNIIASFLAHGKKILFVSEKIAALRVVFENLRRANLSDFAIELHSNKTNKKEFIDDLYKTATSPKYDVAFKTAHLSSRYYNAKTLLTDYEDILHKEVNNFTYTLYQVISEYAKYEVYPSFNINLDVEEKSNFDLDRAFNALNEYIHYAKLIGYDYRKNPLYGINQVKSTYLVYDFENDLKTVENILKLFKAIKDNFTETNLELNTIEDIYDNYNTIGKILECKTFNTNYLLKANRNKLLRLIESYQTNYKKLQSDVLKTYDKTIIQTDLDALYTNYQNESSHKLFNKKYKQLHQEILKYRTDDASSDVILEELKQLLDIKNSLTELQSVNNTLTKVFGSNFKQELNLILLDIKSLDSLPDMNLSNEAFLNIKKVLNSLNIDPSYPVVSRMKLVNLSNLIDYASFNAFRTKFEVTYQKIMEITNYKDQVSTYLLLTKVIEEIKSLDCLDYLHKFLDHNEDINNLAVFYKKMFLKQKIDYTIEANSVLKNNSSYDLENVVSEFEELDEKALHINRDIIISRNSRLRPDSTTIIEGSSFKILDKEYNKARRQMPIRQLLEQIFDLALDVKPVFLMSPLSVSTYLASRLNLFDCVIFDEASQIFASDALGSIYRAKQCIVIGDTKQMPPTAFFQATGEDANDDVEFDMESILDKASYSFPTTSLRWHYRSRSEELITFSNKEFYDANLITIPQAKNHEKGFGIDFEYIENGRYDQSTRTNPTEARHVCDMVFEHYQNSDKSLGVVAFSNVQAELIADLVEKRIAKEPHLKELLYKNEEEPFFVKNLESVQGDERDRIIFSIAYGYNEENKFHQRFGPLNSVGGERRLNVAVTRAKFNITIVSSIKYTDINTKTTSSKGVKLLKDYLQFAESIVMHKNYDQTDDMVINQLKEYIEKQGFTCLTNYGTSSFRIDLAVKKDDKLFLAVMLDKKPNKDTISDVFRLEKLLLERLGWHYHKVYKLSYLTDMETELERLDEALKNDGEITQVKEVEDISYLEEDELMESFKENFDDYRCLTDEQALEYYDYKGLAYMINELIKSEEPMAIDYLYQRVAKILDKKTISKQLKDEINEALPKNCYTLDEKFLCISKDLEIRFRANSNRELSHIHPLEYTDAIKVMIMKNHGLVVEAMYKLLALILDMEKATPTIKKIVDNTLESLKYDRTIIKNKDKYYNVNNM